MHNVTNEQKPSRADPTRGVESVTIGRHRIGPAERVFIVAEAGVNHDGSVEAALRLVDAAVDAGADAVKFQMFRAKHLVTTEARTAGYQRKTTGRESQKELLEQLELSFAEFTSLRDHCVRRGITFLVTPFGSWEVGRLIELGVCAIKIASTDLTNEPLLSDAVASGVPLILSTGASTEKEIDGAVGYLRRVDAGDRLVLLHCVSCYPTPPEAINLRAIATLTRRYGVPCGLSDHTVSTQMGAWAVAAGADVLEKHFTLDRCLPGPDHAMSLDPSQLKEFVSYTRAVEKALGDGQIGLSDCETEVRAVAARSVVSIVDIEAGTQLTRDMITLKRPGMGIPPADLTRVAGRRAAVDIPRDTVLSWDMVQ